MVSLSVTAGLEFIFKDLDMLNYLIPSKINIRFIILKKLSNLTIAECRRHGARQAEHVEVRGGSRGELFLRHRERPDGAHFSWAGGTPENKYQNVPTTPHPNIPYLSPTNSLHNT